MAAMNRRTFISQSSAALALCGMAAARPREAEVAVVLLDDCDPDFKGKEPRGDGVRVFSAKGKELWKIQTLNNCQEFGLSHGVALDRRRGLIHVRELVGKRVTTYDLTGKQISLQEKLAASALAVHPPTGQVWCPCYQGEMVVLDPQGRRMSVHKESGSDIAYDAATDSFWLADLKRIQRVDLDGKPLMKDAPTAAWAFVSIAPAPFAGGCWVVERAHPQVKPSVNQVLFVTSEGKVTKRYTREDWMPFGVACDQKTNTAWVVNYRRSLIKVPLEGDDVEEFPITARSVCISPTTDEIWVATESDLLKIEPNGKIAMKCPRGKQSDACWLAAF